MQAISSNLAKQTFGRVLEAAQHEPVLIENHHHPTAVILSVAEYDRLKFKGVEQFGIQPQASVQESSVKKALPVIPFKPGYPKSCLGVQEMIHLVHEVESGFDA